MLQRRGASGEADHSHQFCWPRLVWGSMRVIGPTFDGKRTIPSWQISILMAELLQLKPGDKLLEIGTGSGYQTELWAQQGCEVHTIEMEPWIDTTKLTGDYVFLHTGDGIHGLPNHAPFTAIVATCGIEAIPRAWNMQLSSGGRLVCPIGSAASQRLTLFHKIDGELRPIRVAAYTRFQMMREKPKLLPAKYAPYELSGGA
jgi:protein-L-isoaspartate(D-aspartate) O-methyltransferase